MTKKTIILVILIAVISISSNIFYNNYLNFEGQFLYPYSKDNKSGFCIYTPKKIINNYKYIIDGNYYDELVYNNNKTKVLAIKYIEEPKRDDYAIVEIDLKTNSISPLIKYKFDETVNRNDYIYHFDSIKYIPKKNAISYKWNYHLFIYDISTKKEQIVTDFTGMYSWDKDGNSFIYSDSSNSKIYRYSVNGKKREFLFDGFSPIYSNDYNLVAFKSAAKPNADLIIKEVNANKQWVYKFTNEAIYYYKFSPDDTSIAIIQDNNDLLVTGGKKIKIVDYKNDQIVDISNTKISQNSFDWK